jgi:bacterioferritin-associated ferredoxin
MIVCSCYGVSDRTILKLIEDGAETPQEIEQACGAGGDCGSCKRQVCELVESEKKPTLPLQQVG